MSERAYGWFVVAGLGTLVLLTKVIFNAGGVEWFTTFTLGVLFALAMVWAIEADDTDPSLEKCSDCGWVVGTNTDCLPCTHHRSSV